MSEQNKVVVRFGRRIASAIAEPGSWAGLPCENVDGGAVVQGGALSSALNTEHATAVTVEAPSRIHGDGPVHAICIAPDSPIEACNLHVANGQTYRVGVGAPFIGRIDDMRNIRVSPARGIPALYRWPAAVPTYAQFTAYERAWDMPDIESDDLNNYDGAGAGRTIALPKPPVKLLLLRGGAAALVASQTRRSVYNAEMLFRTDAFSKTNGCHFVVITDGRRRVRVEALQQALAYGSAGTASVQVFGVGSVKTSDYDATLNGIGNGRIDAATYDELLPVTAIASAAPASAWNPTIFDYGPGNPYFAFHVVVTSDVADTRGNIVVTAWDE